MSESKPKYGIAELAAKMGIQPASARVALRKAGVEKNDGVYAWKSQADMRAVIKKLGGGDKAPAKKAAKDKAPKASAAE